MFLKPKLQREAMLRRREGYAQTDKCDTESKVKENREKGMM